MKELPRSVSVRLKKKKEPTYASIEWYKKKYPKEYADKLRGLTIDKMSIQALMFMIRENTWDRNKSYQENIQNMTTHRQESFAPNAPNGQNGAPPQLQSYVSKV